jgi:ribosome-binding factor A
MKHDKKRKGRDSHKTAQFCAQVQRVLDSAILEALSSDDLDAYVIDVQPAPNAGNLLVVVQPATGPSVPNAEERILAQLQSNIGFMRTIVAHSISRRRVPNLVFQVLPKSDFQ